MHTAQRRAPRLWAPLTLPVNVERTQRILPILTVSRHVMSRCLIWGSVRYAVCLDLFFTPDMMQLILQRTSLHSECECQDEVMWMSKRYLFFVYSCRRQTTWWPLDLLFNRIDVSTFSAVHCCGSLLKPAKNIHMKVFLEELGISMVSSGIVQRKHLPCSVSAAAIAVELQPAAPACTENTDTAGSAQA